MASAKNTPITQFQDKEIKNLYKFFRMKYIFEPITESLINNMQKDYDMIMECAGTTDKAERQLEKSKKFLMDKINAHKNNINTWLAH